MEAFKEKVERLFQRHEELITRKNVAVEDGNGIFTRYKYPVVTAAHTPVFWRYDLDEKSNPDRKSTRLNSSHNNQSRMPSSA